MTPKDPRPAFCLWREECDLFKACAHSVDLDQPRFCPTYRGPYCGRFTAKETPKDKEKA